jgi:small-conductance mechanosensitive channel
VDLQEKRQLDLAGQVARVKARTRPWRAIIALVLAAAAGVTSWTAGTDFGRWHESGHLTSKAIAASTAVIWCLFALIAVLGLAGKARDALRPVTGMSHASVVRYAIVLTGVVATLIVTLALLKVPVGQLILGGAVTTILIGIAAQQSLSNVFAGIVLLLSRPFGVGDAVRFRSGALSGQIDGVVTEIGITYVRVETEDGLYHLPNSQALAAAVGPLPPGHLAQPSPPPAP